jgi:magnesium-transporting ATPase (P-type)
MSDIARVAPEPASAFWHAVPALEVIGRLQTDPVTGLDTSEVSQRLAKYGPNRLPEGKRRGPLMRFLAQLNNILVFVLLAAGFVKLMVGLWLDAGVILVSGLQDASTRTTVVREYLTRTILLFA